MAVNLALLVIMVYGVGRYYGHGLERSWFLFPLALGFFPFLKGLHLGQINVVTEFGIFLALVAETALPVVAGAGLALAICTKVTPVALLGYYLVNKRFKALAATLAAVAVLCAIAAVRYGWAPFFTYARLFPSLLRVHGYGYFSLAGRLDVDESAAQSVQTALTIAMAAIVLLSALCAWIGKQREPLFIVVCLAAMLTPNIVWDHHFVFFLMPLLVWMAWSNFRAPVVLWCCGGLALVQAARAGIVPVRDPLESALYAHAFGQASILLLLLWQIEQVCGRFGRGKAVRNTVAGLMALGLLLEVAFSGYGKPGNAAGRRGDAAVHRRDADAAIAEYSQAIRLEPHCARAYYSRALVYYLKHDWDKAVAGFTEAIQVDPNYARAWLIRGASLQAEDNFDKAIADYTEAIRLDPTTPEAFRDPDCVAVEAYIGRGLAYASRGELDRAIADYTMVVRFDPRNANVYCQRAMIYAQNGDPTKAIADFTEAIRLDPSAAAAYTNRGIAYKEIGQAEKAKQDFAKAKELGHKP